MFGALGSMKDAIKEKLTPHPNPIETRSGEEGGRASNTMWYGGEGEAKGGQRLSVDEEGIPVVVRMDVKATTAGETASRLKEADQMHGQTFNDVGPLDDEEEVDLIITKKKI